jgi:hypothetical protein
MAFQFQCPQGHLLEGDESQAGQHCQCPTCGMLFIIPEPIAAPAAEPQAPFIPGGTGDSQQSPFVPGGPPDAGPINPMAAPAEPEVLHIPCPNGHELETPVDMLDQEVLCPQCNAQFKLKRTNSVEYKTKKELEEKLRLEKTGNLWLTWAIVAVVLVGLILVGLAVFSQMNQ